MVSENEVLESETSLPTEVPSVEVTTDSSLPRIAITICTYNEAENLDRLLHGIREQLPDADILVVDDDSPDGTSQLAEQWAERDDHVHAFRRVAERGLGTATLFAFQKALQAGYEILINMDADFSHDPRHLPQLLEALEQSDADVVVGSRYVEQGGIEGWPFRRHLMSRAINAWTRTWMGLKQGDCSGSYRAYRCDLLQKVDFSKFRSVGYAVQEEMLFRCARAGAKIVEVPIQFVDREAGRSKINMKEAMKAVWIIARCSLESKKDARDTETA